MSMKKKTKKRIIIISIICVILIALVISVLLRPKDAAYNEETVKSGDINTYYSFSGNIEAKEKQSLVSDKIMQIKSLKVKEGDKVKKGDVIFDTSMNEEYTSKIDGEIAKIYIEEGAQLMAGLPIADITNYDELQVTIKIDEFDIGAVTEGKDVTATVNALEKNISGKIKKVSREATTLNGISYFTASVDLESDPELLVGMSVEVKLLNQSVSGATTISMKALQFDNENKPYVYCKDAENKPYKKEVEIGINDGITVEIKTGLSVGDTILIPKDNFYMFFPSRRSNGE